MGFFKRPTFVPPEAGFTGKPLHAAQQWQQQPSALDSHRLAELRALSMRMESLHLQMNQLAASVKNQKQRTSSSMPHEGTMKDREQHQTGPTEPQHPGPCPFPTHEEVPRFVELDDSEPRANQAAFSAAEMQAQFMPEAGPQGMSQATLEHLLREGSQARARSASPAPTGFASSPGSSYASANAFVNHGQPHAPNFSQRSQGDLYHTHAGMPGHIPAQANSIPRAGVGSQFNPMSMAGIPGAMPASLAGSYPGNLGDYLPPQGAQMGAPSSPFMSAMPQCNNAHLPGQHIHPFTAGLQPGQPQLGYQFPNAFGLEQGPHKPGFGNGFSMQQIPSVLGQMEAQFSMPFALHVGRPGSSAVNFGY